jgi:adenosylcobinamide kinase/adenosylcobinamide-phosphate guanylyltransferase
MAELIIGGARSGKSTYAEKLAQEAEAAGQHVIYIATAEIKDEDMAARIARHRAARPAHWVTQEAPLYLARTLRAAATAETCILVDCLTLWLTNLFFAGQAAAQAEAGQGIDCPLLRAELQALERVLPELPGRVLFVSNEVGCGIVPMSRLARVFADEQGWLNQRVARLCERVTLMVAGLPLQVKP